MSVPAPRLSEWQVGEIKRLFRVGFNDAEIADRIGCGASTVRQIRVGEIYRPADGKLDWPAPVRSRQA